MESDKSGSNVAAFDVCFHPEALTRAQQHKSFRDMLVRTGIDGVQQAYRTQQQDVKLSSDFHILKGILYKQGQVPTMLIDKATREEKWKGAENPPPAVAPSENPPADVPAATPNGENQEEPPPEPAPTISANKPAAHSTTVKRGNREPVVKKGFLNSNKSREAIYPDGSSEGAPKKVPQPPLISELKEPYKAPAPKPQSTDTSDGTQSVRGGMDMKERTTSRRMVDSSPPTSSSTDKAPVVRVKERGEISMGDFEGVDKAAGMVAASNRYVIRKLWIV